MNAPSIVIKVKGASALKALGVNAPGLTGLKVKAAVVGLAPAVKGAVKTVAAAPTSVVAAAAAPAATHSVAALSTSPAVPGTIWSGTGFSLGLGLGLGGWGPLILLGTVGVVGAGLYLYRASLQAAAEADEFGEDAPIEG